MRNHLGYRVKRRFSVSAGLTMVAMLCLGQTMLWLATLPDNAATAPPGVLGVGLTVALGLLVFIALQRASARRLLPWRTAR